MTKLLKNKPVVIATTTVGVALLAWFITGRGTEGGVTAPLIPVQKGTLQINAGSLGQLTQPLVDLCEGGTSIDRRLTRAQQVEVGAVNDEDGGIDRRSDQDRSRSVQIRRF